MRSSSHLAGGASAVRRHWVLSAVVVFVLVVGVGAWLTFRPAAAATTTFTSTVTSGTFASTVSASGTITPARSQQLTFPSGGTVTQVKVAVGDRVSRGEVLARMDASALAAQLDAAVATLDSAQTQLTDDVAAGASASQLAADHASVASATSQLAGAHTNLAGATLTAPFSGRVSAVGVAVGDSTGLRGPGLGRDLGWSVDGILGVHRVLVGLDLGDHGDLDRVVRPRRDRRQQRRGPVRKGMQAVITPTGSTQPVFGVVESIGVIAQSTSGSTGSTTAAAFPVTIRVTGSTTGLYAGSSATASITVRQATNVLTVPTRAVSGTGGSTYVTVVRNGKHVKTPITIGQTYGPETEVTKGLSAGDVVVLGSFTAPTGGTTGTGNRLGGFTRGGGQGGTGGGGGFGGGGFGGFGGPAQ